MQILERAFGYFGGILLAAGLLWVAVSGGKPGANALSEALPPVLVNPEGGIALAVLGAGMFLLGKVFGRFAGRAPAIAGAAAGSGGATTAAFVRTGDGAPGGGDNGGGGGPQRQSAAQRRVCLKPAWPQRETGSWVGGVPRLPATTIWPVRNGAPLPFQAQIALSDMPETLWGGLGPRSGWLVFFGNSENGQDAVVLHVDGAVAPVSQPEGVAHHWHWNTENDALREMFGPAADIPPRWFLDLADPESLGAIEDMEDAETENPHFWNDETGEWIWAPSWTTGRSGIMGRVSALPALRNGVDWPSVFCMLGVVRSRMNDRARYLDQSTGRYAPDEDIAALETWLRARAPETLDADGAREEAAVRKRLDAARARDERHVREQAEAGILARRRSDLEALEARFLSLFEDTPFDPAHGAEVRAFVEATDAELAGAGGSSIGAHVQRGIEQVMENYARIALAEDPDTVPAELFELFAPLWERQCAETAVFLGMNGPAGTARLIDLPSNPLTGLAVGDEARFQVDMRAEDLASASRGRSLDPVFGDVRAF